MNAMSHAFSIIERKKLNNTLTSCSRVLLKIYSGSADQEILILLK